MRTQKIFGIPVPSDHPVVLVSPTWGLLGKFYTVASALAAKDGIEVKTKWPYEIPTGHRPQDAEIFMWRSERWMKVEPTEL
jgi:hypothetical protein